MVLIHIFFGRFQNWSLRWFGEKLSLHIILAMMLAAVLTALVWSFASNRRDVLSLVFVLGGLLYILFSRPLFQARLSFFLFFLFGALTGLDEKKPGNEIPILLILGTALLSEWLPALFSGGIQFYWLDLVGMAVGGFAGRLTVCSNRG